MARIRSIKPEIWTDEKIVQLPVRVRLFFIGLFNFADDYGAFEDKPNQLHYQIFPCEPDFDAAESIDILSAAGLIERAINLETGDILFRIVNFEKHQKVDRPTKSKLLPDQNSNYKKAIIPAAARREIAEKYGCQPGETKSCNCYYCGEPGMIHWQKLNSGKPGSWVWFTLEIDHLESEFNGGTTESANLVLACRECNRSKCDSNFYGFLLRKYATPREYSRGIENTRAGREWKGREWKGMEGKGIEPSASNTRAREAAPAEEIQNNSNPKSIPPAPPSQAQHAIEPPSPLGEGTGVGLNDFAETYQAIAAWGESDTGHAQIVAWKKITGYRDSQHGPTTDELAKFVSYHLDPKRRDAFLAAPIEYFCEKFPGWLTNAKTMNRKPRGRPPAPNQPSPRSTTGNARTLEPTAIAHILHHTAP